MSLDSYIKLRDAIYRIAPNGEADSGLMLLVDDVVNESVLAYRSRLVDAVKDCHKVWNERAIAEPDAKRKLKLWVTVSQIEDAIKFVSEFPLEEPAPIREDDKHIRRSWPIGNSSTDEYAAAVDEDDD